MLVEEDLPPHALPLHLFLFLWLHLLELVIAHVFWPRGFSEDLLAASRDPRFLLSRICVTCRLYIARC